MDTPKNVDRKELIHSILELKRKKHAVILAHYYQRPEIQELADQVGDSLALAQFAKKSKAKVILFAGVKFMAETAKILNPKSMVLLPDLEAGCSLSDSCPADQFKAFIEKHPDHIVITYINTSVEIKTMSDIICTSSNAEEIIRSIPLDREIIFAPDKNLGTYLMNKTGRKMLLWNGVCHVHEAFSFSKLVDLKIQYPDAEIIAHPESETEVLKLASFIGSTKALIDYIKKSESTSFIVATEAGILHEINKHIKDKLVLAAPIAEDNACACSECAYMKLNTLEKIHAALKNESPEITLSDDVMKRALSPLNRMLDFLN
jgi:quinolinate synthase